MAVIRSPARTRAIRFAIAKVAVEPVPRPTTIPSVTSAAAASAAARFRAAFGSSVIGRRRLRP